MSKNTPKKIVEKVSAVLRNRNTYHLGLVQAKAYRMLKQQTTEALIHLDISTIEWAFLGLLYERPKAVRASVVAEDLGVEAPFVTLIIKKLKKRSLIELKEDAHDSRVKLLCLTSKGKQFVQSTEIHVREVMRPLVQGIDLSDLATYIAVLEQIIQNVQKRAVLDEK
ncbi:winged helix-turn-helix transcriptional regulator [Patescibacteria group bacterium]|nr:winged helix-turn-helix transcriptional regulator [Patescibacteria group bacterium]